MQKMQQTPKNHEDFNPIAISVPVFFNGGEYVSPGIGTFFKSEKCDYKESYIGNRKDK